MVRIPTGTVIFLFTDIEGSTRLWENQAESMRAAFTRQEAILREAAVNHRGYAYKMIGDAFQVAFSTALEGLAAALEAQLRLQAESWGEAPLRVRMALHTGVTEERGDDYVGPVLNRAARLLAAGYGGQILLSQAVVELVKDELPAGVSLVDLGEHYLKDLVRPEHIYQLAAPGLPLEFPPLKTLYASHSNLPVQLTSFIGRETEMVQIRQLFSSARLVTLTGIGGTGKTRLALQVAADLLKEFRDGVWLVELAPLADPILVPLTVAAALGVRESPGRSSAELLVEYLRERSLLLIMDNCEQVVEASARLADTLLHACPNLRILATSRERLGTEGEAAFRVPSLALPDPQRLPPFEKLAEYEGVLLFVERARAASPDFALTSTNAPHVVKICHRLDGIPLAIELAAARVRLLSVDQIASRLDHVFHLLTGGDRTGFPRHQTLRALIDWSYDLLSPVERGLFQRLAVFAGGWTLDAAEAVCGEVEEKEPRAHDAAEGTIYPEDILDLLGQLVDKSLVLADPGLGEETRYRLLETIRQYAREKLLAAGGEPDARSRHLDYFLQLAGQAEPNLRGMDQVVWLDRLEVELDNLRSALEESLAESIEAGLNLAAHLMWFWHIRGHEKEGIDWYDRLLDAEEQQRSGLPLAPASRLSRAKALAAAGCLLAISNNADKSRRFLEEAEALFRESGPAGRRGLAISLLYLGIVQTDQSQVEALLKESLDLFMHEEDDFYIAECYQYLGTHATMGGDLELAKEYHGKSLALREKIGDMDGMGTSLMRLGETALVSGNHRLAEEFLNRSLACYQAVENREFISTVIFDLATAAWLRGDLKMASLRSDEAFAISQEIKSYELLGSMSLSLGWVAWAMGDYDLAVMRCEKALEISQEAGIVAFRAYAFQILARVAFSKGDYDQSRAQNLKALEICRETHDREGITLTLSLQANLAVVWGDMKRGVLLLAFVEDFFRTNTSILVHPIRVALEDFNRGLAEARAALGEEAFNTTWAEGHAMTLEQAIAEGLKVEPQPGSHSRLGSPKREIVSQLAQKITHPAGLVEDLSARELEVLRMIAAGASNLEIARALFIDIGTVKSHNTHIFAKLEVKSRTQAVMKARSLGLL